MYKEKHMQNQNNMEDSSLILTQISNITYSPIENFMYYYLINITVHTWKSLNNPSTFYYDVQYKYKFQPDAMIQSTEQTTQLQIVRNEHELEQLKFHMHPFYMPNEIEITQKTMKDYETPYVSMIIKTPVTTQMIEHLLMDNETLATYTQNMDVHVYRKHIMHCLSYFSV